MRVCRSPEPGAGAVPPRARGACGEILRGNASSAVLDPKLRTSPRGYSFPVCSD